MHPHGDVAARLVRSALRRKAPAVLFAFVVACSSRDEREITGETAQRFTSAGAVLAEFEFEARVIAPTNDPEVVRRLLETQLMYTVGQLNGDRSVARLDRAQFTGKTLGTVPGDPTHYQLTYQVKLPVAWGGGALPSSYAFTLPLRVGEADQTAFATKYMSTCTDPEGGIVDAVEDAGRMFLFYRPQLPSCSPSPLDVFSSTAAVTLSAENTSGRFPEYHRIWEDHALDFVAIFGRENATGSEDAGQAARDAFVTLAEIHLKELQPSPERRRRTDEASTTHLEADLADGRRVIVDVFLTPPHVADESTTFDGWYDAKTPNADVIFYAGHAGLGKNVRALAKKGAFTPGKYAVHVLNGCDTFAYLDPTLDTRRGGSRNLDLVTNVLGGWFHTGDETAGRFLRAMTSALTLPVPQTFREIAEGVDPSQVMVVSGEEDNVFVPGMIPAPPSPAAPAESAPSTLRPEPTPAEQPAEPATDSGERDSSGSCANARARTPHHSVPLWSLVAMIVLTSAWRRRLADPHHQHKGTTD
jgi:hypothetical protein